MSGSAPGIELTLERIATPIGDTLLVGNDGVLVAVDFADRNDRVEGLLAREGVGQDGSTSPEPVSTLSVASMK